MKRTASNLLIAAGLTGAAFAGGTVVSLAAGAQTDDTTPETTAPANPEPAPPADGEAPPEAPPEGCEGRLGKMGAGLDAAAEAIGISAEDLRTALRDGQTMAEVAQANGVDVPVVIDALVAEANAHLDEAVAEGRLTPEEADERRGELTERITEAVNEGGPLHDGPRGRHGRGGEHVGTAAEAIGIDVADLGAALRDGQTMAEVAQANGVDPQVVIDALVAEANAHLDEAVAEGRLTPEEADERRGELAERITEAVNEGRPDGPRGPRGPRGPVGDDEAPEVEGSSFTA